MTVRRTKLDVEQYELGSLRLYSEDLRAIATAASEAGNLAITCDGFEATSPEDFGDGLPEKLKSVTIKTVNPVRPGTVEIRLSERESVVQLTEPDTLMAGVVSRVRLICEPRRRWLPKALRLGHADEPGVIAVIVASLIIVLAILAGLVTGGLSPHPARGLPAASIALVVSLGVVVVASGFLIWVASRPWVQMINAPRADRPTYWQRTRDMWLVGIITALLGAVAGYLLGRFG